MANNFKICARCSNPSICIGAKQCHNKTPIHPYEEVEPLQALPITAMVTLKPIKDAPRDGREVLCTDGKVWRVCVPKLMFPTTGKTSPNF